MCSRQLVPGEEFALLPEGLICGTHIKQQHHQAPVPHEPLPGINLSEPNVSLTEFTVQLFKLYSRSYSLHLVLPLDRVRGI